MLGRKEPELLPNEQWSYMDMAESVSPRMLEGSEVLCHLAYSMTSGRENLRYNQHLLDAVNTCQSIEQVILMSSTSVYGATESVVVNEESVCEPVGDYPETKLACETLWQRGLRDSCDLIVLRPSTVIGPDSIGLASMIRDALHGPVVGPIKRSALYHRSVHYVAVSNVVAAVLFFLRRPRSSAGNVVRETYIVSDDHYQETKSYATMQDAVRISAGRRPFPGLAMPRFMLPLLGKLTGRAALGQKRSYSSSKLHGVGFRDAVTLYDEVERTVQSSEQKR